MIVPLPQQVQIRPEVQLFEIGFLNELVNQNLQRISAVYLSKTIQEFFRLTESNLYRPKHMSELQSLFFMYHQLQSIPIDYPIGKNELQRKLETFILENRCITNVKTTCPFCESPVNLSTKLCPNQHRLELCSRTYLPLTTRGNLKCSYCSRCAISGITAEGGFEWLSEREYCPLCGLTFTNK